MDGMEWIENREWTRRDANEEKRRDDDLEINVLADWNALEISGSRLSE
jgi:hypothetical protein